MLINAKIGYFLFPILNKNMTRRYQKARKVLNIQNMVNVTCPKVETTCDLLNFGIEKFRSKSRKVKFPILEKSYFEMQCQVGYAILVN